MRNKTRTLKNMKHLKKITQKIIDNDNKQTQAEISPSLKELLQKISEEMDKSKNRIQQIEQDAIHGKFLYKNGKQFSPEEMLEKLDNYNLLITITIGKIKNFFPISKIIPKHKGKKKNENSICEKNKNFNMNIKNFLDQPKKVSK